MACKYSSYLISVCVKIRKQWSMSVVGGGGITTKTNGQVITIKPFPIPSPSTS